jgi:hypothetical protein
VRFENESVKGDHKHALGLEESYRFIDVETLVADFLAEIEKARKKNVKKQIKIGVSDSATVFSLTLRKKKGVRSFKLTK